MQFVSDPPIATKIERMKQRVRWQDPALTQRGIDQTQLVLEGAESENPEFSFLVLGDSGSGAHRGHNPQRQIAEQMLEHLDSCRFVLHTGDVIYLVGSSEYYAKNFIEPYRELIVGGDRPDKVCYDQMVFKQPFFLVPGNHDYYDLPLAFGLLSQLSQPLRYLFRSRIDFDVGWHGSHQGDAYAKAFLDYLTAIHSPEALVQHLDRHYSASCSQGRCLRYEPGQFTRLPNRYYSFRQGGIDFFALDSNTFNGPLPIPDNRTGANYRQRLQERWNEVERQKQQVIEKSMRLNPSNPEESEQLDDLRTRLEHLEEIARDIDKQLSADRTDTVVDQEQLAWLRDRLVESWHTDGVRGRVIFFHHPPYVTEATKWNQAQTIAVRERLRQVLDQVAEAVGEAAQNRPLVDLVLNGHAHCLEYLRTSNTGHGDAHLNWIICGGSGYSLRRQREEGIEIYESPLQDGKKDGRAIARSLLYVGRSGHGGQKHRPYSFLRIDVQAGSPPRFVVRPFVSERFQGRWVERSLEAFTLQ